MRRPPGLLALLLALGALTSCGYLAAGPRGDDTARLYLLEEIPGLDPARTQEAVGSLCCLQVYDCLYQYKYLVRPYELEPCLAASMPEVSKDGLVHTIHLKQGVRFQDDPCFPGGKGREVVADDVVFSILRLMDQQTASPGSWILDGRLVGLDAFEKSSAAAQPDRTSYGEIEGLRALDRYTVRFELTKPYPQLHYVLAMPYTSIVPHEAIARYGDDFLNHPVGTGPYVVESYMRAQRIVFRRNPTYRDERYPSEGTDEDRRLGRLDDAGKRLPLCERLVFTVYKETQPLWFDFLLGKLDLATIPKDQWDSAVDPRTGVLRADLARRGVTLEKTPMIEIIYDAFNMRDDVLGKPNGERGRAIRRAMSLAFDEQWARKKLYNDRVQSIQGILVPEFPEYDPSFVNPWKQQPGESQEQALARARTLLADAGYTDPARQIPPPSYEVLDSVTDEQFYSAFRRDEARIGIDVTANKVTWTSMMADLDEGRAKMWGLSWTADYPDAQNFFQLFYGPNKAPGPNSCNYEDPEFDRLYEKASTLFPGPERTRLYRRMQEIVVRDCPWIIKYRRIHYDVVLPWLHNFKYHAIQDKWGKYIRVDGKLRRRISRGWSKPDLMPVWIALGAVILLFVGTVLGARSRVRPW